MPTDDESSDLSSLSSLSPAPSEDELEEVSDLEPSSPKSGILKFFPKLSDQPAREPSPPPRKRSPSPPHEFVLADNPDIAFLVMFRNRFTDTFPKSLPHFGPQELERDVVEPIPGRRVEHFLCALLGLLLNRKQDVKPGHYGRALEDAVTSHKNQWAPSWEDKNPLSGGATFTSMNPTERLTLLRTLVLWSMSSSEALKAVINQSYKQNRHEDDLNQPKAVQSWGSDGDRRRYFLIEGHDDTAFRVYRESNPAGINRTWWSVAGSIEELRELAEKLDTKNSGPKAKKLSHKMIQAIPRFEAGDEKRKRREYRLLRKEQFKRPEPGFSMYEGRTRGKRMKYTFSDDEDAFLSDSTTNRRSARNTGTNTPAETGPVVTSSGRQIRAPTRLSTAAAESVAGSVQGDLSEFDQENSVGPTGRPRRSAVATPGTDGWTESAGHLHRKDSVDTDDEESEADFGDDEGDVDAHVPAESEEEDDDELNEDEVMVDDDLDDEPRSLVVKLSVTPPKLRGVLVPIDQAVNALPTPEAQDWTMDVDEGAAPVVEMQDARAPATAMTSPSTLGVPPKALTPTPEGPVLVEERRFTPEPMVQTGELEPQSQPAMPTTSLAFRGSPDKPEARALARPVDVTHQQ